MDPTSAELNGRVECREVGEWFGVVDPSVLVGKHYDLFALLFGVSNFAKFEPLFPSRGLPADCDGTLRLQHEEFPHCYFGATWASYNELASIDWSLDAREFDSRVYQYHIDAEGRERYMGKALPGALGLDARQVLDGASEYRRGRSVFRRRRATRREAKASTGFDLLMRLMHVLACHFGGENVRLVVFFD